MNTTTIACLTVLQPWASALMWGEKQYETRSWPTPKTIEKGQTIVIHAGKAWSRTQQEIADSRWPGQLFPLGVLLGVVTFAGCYRTEDVRGLISVKEYFLGDYSGKRFAWRVKHSQRLNTPIPYRGQQGVFYIPREIIEHDH